MFMEPTHEIIVTSHEVSCEMKKSTLESFHLNGESFGFSLLHLGGHGVEPHGVGLRSQ